MSNFAFGAAEFPAVHEAAVEAERQAGVSPTALFAGKTVEVAVKWAFRTDPGLKLPYQDNIAALLHEPSFRRATGEAVFAKARYINTLRNRAVHEEKTISSGAAARPCACPRNSASRAPRCASPRVHAYLSQATRC
jgi:type I restriction enzyme R subunit